jgi:hypothetical protein
VRTVCQFVQCTQGYIKYAYDCELSLNKSSIWNQKMLLETLKYLWAYKILHTMQKRLQGHCRRNTLKFRRYFWQHKMYTKIRQYIYRLSWSIHKLVNCSFMFWCSGCDHKGTSSFVKHCIICRLLPTYHTTWCHKHEGHNTKFHIATKTSNLIYNVNIITRIIIV